MDNLIAKAVREYRAKGTKATIKKGIRYPSRQLNSKLQGNSIHYKFHQTIHNIKYNKNIKIFWVSPDEIQYLTGKRDVREQGHLDYSPYFKPRELDFSHTEYTREVPYGTEIGGDWDTKKDKFNDLVLYKSIEEYYHGGIDWTDTGFFQGHLEGYIVDGYDRETAEKMTHKKCSGIDRLYEKLKEQGYRSQAELGGHPLHEITVNISRDGDLLYNCEGRHRLSIAKLLNIESVPVVALVAHPDYNGEILKKHKDCR